MQTVNIANKTKATVVGTRITVANTPMTRLVGLLGRRHLDANCGMLISPSSGVHTFGMLFPIDVVALDKQDRVLALWPDMRPWRMSGVSFKTHSILELPVGQIARSGLEVGDHLESTVIIPSPRTRDGSAANAK